MSHKCIYFFAHKVSLGKFGVVSKIIYIFLSYLPSPATDLCTISQKLQNLPCGKWSCPLVHHSSRWKERWWNAYYFMRMPPKLPLDIQLGELVPPEEIAKMSFPAACVLKESVSWVVSFNRALNKELTKDLRTAQWGREHHTCHCCSRELNKPHFLGENNRASKTSYGQNCAFSDYFLLA